MAHESPQVTKTGDLVDPNPLPRIGGSPCFEDFAGRSKRALGPLSQNNFERLLMAELFGGEFQCFGVLGY